MTDEKMVKLTALQNVNVTVDVDSLRQITYEPGDEFSVPESAVQRLLDLDVAKK